MATKKSSAPVKKTVVAKKTPAPPAKKPVPTASKKALVAKKPAVAKKALVAKKAVVAKKPASVPAKKAAVAKKPASVPAKKAAVAKKTPAPPAKKTATTASKKAPVAKKAVVAKKPASVPAKKAAVAEKTPAPPAKNTATTASKKATPIAPKPKIEVFATDPKFIEEQIVLLRNERSIYHGQEEDLKAEAASLAQEREPGDVQFDEESGEGGTVAVDRERDLVLSAQAHAAVEEIDAALERIASNKYGSCERCHQPIPRSRLRALPYARLCVACKSGGLTRR